MKNLRSRLMATQAWLEARLKGEELPKPEGLLTQNEELWEPLYACYQSLQACGMGIIANGDLLDTLRRVKCFGVPLVRIDIRQESTRHTEALGELTRYLGIGDYESWSEADKQAFLIRELNSKRPLLPRNWQPSAETREVLDTCQVIAEAPQGSIAAYVISMAKTPSDVLAVHLLLKEAGIGFAMPVAPLFETLDEQRQRCHDPAAEYRLVSRPDSGQTDGDDWLFRLSKRCGRDGSFLGAISGTGCINQNLRKSGY